MSNIDIYIEMLILAEQMGKITLGIVGSGNRASVIVDLKDGQKVRLSLEPHNEEVEA